MKELRPGLYDDIEYIPPAESDLAPMLKNCKAKGFEEVAEDIVYVSPTESDLAPMLKNITVKAAKSQTAPSVKIKTYAYEFIE